ncbi:MAG: sialic acid O-acetyltransferase [Bacteroidales bacterium]|nr:sialic acid O-acetyltransferase [Bacteroidales bacterium]
MRHLIIVGARGWGREVYESARITRPFIQGVYDIKGFLDSKNDALDGVNGLYPPILSSPENYVPQSDDVFFIAMGDPKWRKYYAEMIEKKGGTFLTIICEGAYVNPTARIGDGSFIAGWTSISDSVNIGRHVMIHPFSNIGHDANIGDYSSIEAYVFIGGESSIGEESVMHVKSSIIRHKSIGNNVEVGINSVVMRNMPDGISVFGNPARKIDM